MSKAQVVKVVLLVGFLLAMTMDSCLAEGSGMATEEDIGVTMGPSESRSLCDSLTQAINTIKSERRGHMCTTFNGCSGFFCDFGAILLTVWVLPCASPPASRVVVYSMDYEQLLDEVLTYTTKLRGPGYSIQVTFEQLDGQFGLEISDDNIGSLFPYTRFSTDPSHCFKTVCEAVRSSVLDTGMREDTTCSLTSRCDGATCFRDLLGLTMTTKIVECYDPPAVLITINNPFDENGRDLVNEIFTTTSNLTVLDFYEIFVTIHQLGGGIAVEIFGGIKSTDEGVGDEFPTFNGNSTDPFLPPEYPTDFFLPDDSDFPTDFPDYPDEPADGLENTDDGSVLEYTFFPTDQYKPECVYFSLTCLGLQGVVDKAARSNISCETNERCDGVVCLIDVFQNGALFPLSMIVNSCKKPLPSVFIDLKDPNNRGLLMKEVDNDDTISLFTHDIKVTLNQLSDDEKPYPSIGFAIDLTSPPEEGQNTGVEKNIIQYSEIPIICDGTSGVIETVRTSVISLVICVMTTALLNVLFQ